MKKMLFIILALSPLALFASEDVQTDIIPRTVNFLIFAGIVYFILADKLKDFFKNRTLDIQKRLDEVQTTLKESKKKVEDAQSQLEDAKKLAIELVSEANGDVDSIKKKVNEAYDSEINHLLKSFDNKLELETKKSKNQIVNEVLEELLHNDNLSIKQDELVNIILKKVA
jgi:F-type H+-transporting ATPase subunit b